MSVCQSSLNFNNRFSIYVYFCNTKAHYDDIIHFYEILHIRYSFVPIDFGAEIGSIKSNVIFRRISRTIF